MSLALWPSGCCSSATTTFKAALKDSGICGSGLGEALEDASMMFQGISQLLHTVAQELQEPEHVLIPDEHRNAA